MLESAWLFVGRIAFGWTVLTLIGAVYFDADDDTGDGLAMIAGVVGFVLWGVWTFGTLEVEFVEGSTTYAFSHPSLTILGVVLALVPGYIAMTGPIELLNRARQPSTDDI